MDRDYLDVPTQYYIVDIWDRAGLFSTFFGLIQICHGARYRAAGGFVHFVDELCRLPIDSDSNQAIFGIEDLDVGQATFHALSHIPVGIVGV